ncbi:MAG: D-glycero-alpha-D-manno-heptose-1,7-bisphosphate 7-phosphatase [Phycisphaerales bacterium]
MKAVFLDRDGTLIVNDGDLGDPDQVVLCEGVADALAQLRQVGWVLIVVTNQGGVARGRYTEKEVDMVHQRLAEMIDQESGMSTVIDRFYYCPYHPQGTVAEYRREHPWRKPQPGMLLQAARDLGLNLRECWMIGDQSRDIVAAHRAGCRAVHLVLASATDPGLSDAAVAEYTVNSIDEAVDVILNDDDEARAGRSRTRAGRRARLGRSSSGGMEDGTGDDGTGSTLGDAEPFRRALAELTEELRSERQRRSEFTLARMLAGICQLGVILLVVLAFLQVDTFEMFMKWMIGAVLAQLAAATLLVLDLRG